LDYHDAAVPRWLVDLEIEMSVEQLKDLSVLILGLGSSGLAMARWCASHGAQVHVVDTREQPPGFAELNAQHPAATFETIKEFSAQLIQGSSARAVCRSPGLAPAAIAPVLEAACAVGLPVWGELELFCMALQNLKAALNYEPKILAITGTNGKTTVTTLTGQLVERAGKTVAVAGNIGPTLLDTLAAHMGAQTLPQGLGIGAV
jgi:UDP-N-acetylmuramoylalanine--D-glutamate ligase